MAIEEPEYTTIEKTGVFELRKYAPMIVAEVFVSGKMDEATRQGFRLIADYIFGNNSTKTGEKEKIQMTAPVTIRPESQKINMTKPVTIESTDGQWRVQFVMPKQYSLDTLPVPNNVDIKVRHITSQKYAVIRFSGFAGDTKVAEKTTKLTEWLVGRELTPKGPAQLARYNPPWTLPFLRRNEVMIPC